MARIPRSFLSTRRFAATGALAVAGVLSACSPDSLVRSDPPSNIVMPGALTTPSAALAMYTGALNLFASAFGGGNPSNEPNSYVVNSGLMTDEFVNGSNYYSGMDERNNSLLMSTGAESMQGALYTYLQRARVAAFQARAALQQYGPANSGARIGRMYAMEAYAIVLLAEYFCNGIPLSVTPLRGATQLTAGLTTQQLLDHAVVLFDSAITLAGDSVQVVNLAKIGKGRALLDAGQFTAAASAVQGVPQNFVFNIDYLDGVSIVVGGTGYSQENLLQPAPDGAQYAVADGEGGVGLPWSTDARVPTTDTLDAGDYPMPTKYASPSASIRLADGIEAQLIRAEADLRAEGSAWLGLLNDLRANCTSASGCAPVPGITGGTAQLPPLADSLTPVAQLREVMQERGYWMYATGHRQGDLRRLLRPPYSVAPYNISANLVYPNGAYSNSNTNGRTTSYGPDVIAFPAAAEQLNNPNYSGCYDENP